jgi:hypothetical protein
LFECSKKEKFKQFKQFINPKTSELFQSALNEAEEEVSKKALSNSMDDELNLIKAKENANASYNKSLSSPAKSVVQLSSKKTKESLDESLSKTKNRSKNSKTVIETREETILKTKPGKRRHSLANPSVIKSTTSIEIKPNETKRGRKRKSLCVSDIKVEEITAGLTADTCKIPATQITKKGENKSVLEESNIETTIKKQRNKRPHSLANPSVIKSTTSIEIKPNETKRGRKRKSLCVSDIKVEEISAGLTADTCKIPATQITKKVENKIVLEESNVETTIKKQRNKRRHSVANPLVIKQTKKGQKSSQLVANVFTGIEDHILNHTISTHSHAILKKSVDYQINDKQADDKENVHVAKKRGRSPVVKGSTENTSKEDSFNKKSQTQINEISLKRRHSLTTISTENTIDSKQSPICEIDTSLSKRRKNVHSKFDLDDENTENYQKTSGKKKCLKSELKEEENSTCKNNQTKEGEKSIDLKKKSVAINDSEELSAKKRSSKAELKKIQKEAEESINVKDKSMSVSESEKNSSAKKNVNKSELNKVENKEEQSANIKTIQDGENVTSAKQTKTSKAEIKNKLKLNKDLAKKDELLKNKSTVQDSSNLKKPTKAELKKTEKLIDLRKDLTNIDEENVKSLNRVSSRKKSLLTPSIQIPVEKNAIKAKLKESNESMNKSLNSLENHLPINTNSEQETPCQPKNKRMTAIAANLNLSLRRPKSQKEIEKLKSKEILRTMNMEEKLRYIDEKEKEVKIF